MLPLSKTARATGFLASLALACLVPAAEPSRAEEPKLDCEAALSTYELNICAARSYDAADLELNEVYKRALAAVPEMATDKPFDVKSWTEALRKSQRAWLAYRDAECDGHVPMFWTGGSGTTADVIGCREELTKARTRELKARYEEGENAPAEPDPAPPAPAAK